MTLLTDPDTGQQANRVGSQCGWGSRRWRGLDEPQRSLGIQTDILLVCGVFGGWWEDGGSVSEGWPELEDKEKSFVLFFFFLQKDTNHVKKTPKNPTNPTVCRAWASGPIVCTPLPEAEGSLKRWLREMRPRCALQVTAPLPVGVPSLGGVVHPSVHHPGRAGGGLRAPPGCGRTWSGP